MSLANLVNKAFSFGLISGLGLLLDMVIFYLICFVTEYVFMANLLSASAAVSFVFFASVRRVFFYQKDKLWDKFLWYLVYNCIAIVVASLCVHVIAGLGVQPLLAKVVIIPATFLANFFFMNWLLGQGQNRFAEELVA